MTAAPGFMLSLGPTALRSSLFAACSNSAHRSTRQPPLRWSPGAGRWRGELEDVLLGFEETLDEDGEALNLAEELRDVTEQLGVLASALPPSATRSTGGRKLSPAGKSRRRRKARERCGRCLSSPPRPSAARATCGADRNPLRHGRAALPSKRRQALVPCRCDRDIGNALCKAEVLKLIERALAEGAR